jgi:glutamate racemase
MIGIFDSGLGGLTVVKEMYRQLPGYRLAYFGDTARTPYGGKSRELITQYALEDANFLISRGAKLIVVACNTASALATDELRAKLKVPVFEVITPAVDAAVQVTSGKLGVIGTRATVLSRAYEDRLADLAPEVRVTAVACPLFVPLVEEGWHHSAAARTVAKKYLNPLRLRHVDSLILGCTHYPFLRPIIAREMGRKVRLIDPARETVAALKGFLESHPDVARTLARGGQDRFFVSDRTDQFAAIASRWLGRPVKLETFRIG